MRELRLKSISPETALRSCATELHHPLSSFVSRCQQLHQHDFENLFNEIKEFNTQNILKFGAIATTSAQCDPVTVTDS